jgi:glycosyltransferase involved in cell wall biosynthesis
MKTDSISVSIITVCFNSEKTIRRTLESLRDQISGNFEVIIVDGSSTDNTLEIVKEFDGLVDRIISEHDSGIYDAMNKGVALATGEYIAFLNSDDAYLPHTIDAVVKCIKQHKPDVVYGNIEKERRLGDEILTRIEKPRLDDMPKTMGVFHPAGFVHRRFFQKFGGFDTRFKLAADYHFMLRVYQSKARFHYLDEVLAIFTIGGASNYSCGAYQEAITIQTELNTGYQDAMKRLYAKCLKKQRQQRLIAKFARLPILRKIYQNRIKKRWS